MPGAENVKVKDCPFDNIGELMLCGPLVVVTVCGASSWLVQVMLSPTVTVMTCGAKAKLTIWTLCEAGAAAAAGKAARSSRAAGTTSATLPVAPNGFTAAADPPATPPDAYSPAPADVAIAVPRTANATHGATGCTPCALGARGTSGRVIGSPPRSGSAPGRPGRSGEAGPSTRGAARRC